MTRTARSNRAYRRIAAGLAASLLITGGFAAGAGSAAAEGSADGFGSDGGSSIAEGLINGDVDISYWFTNMPGSSDNPTAWGPTGKSVTATFGNIEVTKTIIGRDSRLAGETLTYRTTVSTTDGSDRAITKLLAIESGLGTFEYVADSAKVSYTAADGTRKTEAAHLTWTPWTLPDGSQAYGGELSTGGWQISAANTLVLETTHVWRHEKDILIGDGWIATDIDTGVALDVPGLGVVAKRAMGLPVSCYQRCSTTSRGPFGS